MSKHKTVKRNCRLKNCAKVFEIFLYQMTIFIQLWQPVTTWSQNQLRIMIGFPSFLGLATSCKMFLRPLIRSLWCLDVRIVIGWIRFLLGCSCCDHFFESSVRKLLHRVYHNLMSAHCLLQWLATSRSTYLPIRGRSDTHVQGNLLSTKSRARLT